MDIKERIDKCVDKYKEYAESPEAFAVLFVKKHLKTFKWIKITDYDYVGYDGYKKLKFSYVKCELFERTITPKYPKKSDYDSEYKVILINVQKILNKYVHMLSYMSCIEGAHYDNRIQCNHRFTYTVC